VALWVAKAYITAPITRLLPWPAGTVQSCLLFEILEHFVR